MSDQEYSPEAFKQALQECWPDLEDERKEKVLQFWKELVVENKRQNLTRLETAKEFMEGHLLDVKELVESGLVQFPALDLGSGGGFPGLLAAIVEDKPWVLAESEKTKAIFLNRMKNELDLKNVMVYSGRAEVYLKDSAAETVVTRAVATIDRIYKWIRKCSTWNRLLLMKGPKWDEEWEKFSQTAKGKEFEIEYDHAYSVGEEDKQRRIILLNRIQA